MVFTGDSKGGVRDSVMALPPERSKPPLHNFDLPCLKWGNQRHLRCIKIADSAAVKDGSSADRGRASRSPPSNFSAGRNHEVRRCKKLDSGAVEEGIDAVREKLMCDFKAAADKLKSSLLRKGFADESDEEAETRYFREREEEDGQKEKYPTVSDPAAAVVVETAEEARPWNLRKRRAASKAPVGGNSINGEALRIEEWRASKHSPARSGISKSPAPVRGDKRDKEKEIEQLRPKFSVALSRSEIEADFMEMLGRKPHRRPKKRPRNVQNQLDRLFPGEWLTEVTVDRYKVPENAKR